MITIGSPRLLVGTWRQIFWIQALILRAMNGSSCCVAKSAWFTSNKHSEKSLVPPFKDYRHSSLREKLQTHKFGLELAKYLLLSTLWPLRDRIASTRTCNEALYAYLTSPDTCQMFGRLVWNRGRVHFPGLVGEYIFFFAGRGIWFFFRDWVSEKW